jgi:hypothetical protein
MEFRFCKRDPAHLYTFGLALLGGFFFRAKSITDAVLYIKDYLLKVILVLQYLTNERYNYELLLMIILCCGLEWNNRFKENRFQVKNSWLKPLAIATIVALGTYSDYKEFIYSSFKII